MAFFGGFSHMDRLLRTVTYYGAVIHSSHDDDFADRLNHLYTGIFLIVFSIIVSTKQYVGKPITCWTPSTWSRNHQMYADHACWISNTYWLPWETEIPTAIPDREGREIAYYQWIPFVLLIQALLFYTPSLVWRTFNKGSGINVKDICEIANDMRNLNPESRKRTVHYLSRHLEACLANQREYRSGKFIKFMHTLSKLCCVICGKRYGNYLTIVYFLVKILYLVNVTGQLVGLNIYLETNYTFYGLEIVKNINAAKEWPTTGRFPRVTMCDFVVRQLGNKHRHTVQCVLPINMFNERIYIFIWFWYSFVLFSTIWSSLVWANNMAFLRPRRRYIKKYLRILGLYENSDWKMLDRFVSNYLRHDGVFVLRLLNKNAGELVVTEIIKAMWTNFKKRQTLALLDHVVTNTQTMCTRAVSEKESLVVNGDAFVAKRPDRSGSDSN